MRKGLSGAALVGVSLVLSSLVFGIFFYQSRLPVKSVKVVGAATASLDSDVVKWRVTLTRNTGVDGLKSGYARLNQDLQTFKGLLTAAGLAEKDITVQPVNTNPVYGNYEKSGVIVGYGLMQNVFVISRELGKIETLALNPGSLAEKGLLIQNSNLEFYPSNLGEIKKRLLAEATQDARRRADQIARSTGDRLGRMDSARVGVFQITEPYSTEVSDYGVYNTATRKKDITVTVNASFLLR